MDAQFFKEPPYCSMGFPGGSDSKESTCNVEDLGLILSSGTSPGEWATHSSILAWRIPWTEELRAGYYPWGRKESGTTERLHLLVDINDVYWEG